MKIRLYLDEDVDVALASALRQRGIDVLTTQETGKRQQTDEAKLEYAVQAGRVFLRIGDVGYQEAGGAVVPLVPHGGGRTSDWLGGIAH